MPTIVPDKKAIVFKLNNPNKILTVIPKAKLIKPNVVAVKHGIDETKVLRNLGYSVVEPIKMYYDWPLASARHKPFKAQMDTAGFATLNDRCFILNSMGTGKTLASLYGFDYMHRIGMVNKALVVCPLSTMDRTWGDEVFKSFPHLKAVVVYGTKEKRIKLLKEEADLYIINTDGIKIIQDELKRRPDIDLVIVDEVAVFRNRSTGRWKAINEVLNKQTFRKAWALTGMPTPNSPLDAWAQCKLMLPFNKEIPNYISRARDILMLPVGQFGWKPKEGANQIINGWMQPSIRFSLDECTDLPEQTFITKEVEMSPEQKKAYKEMASKLKAEIAGNEILAVNEAVKASKLIQIASGHAYDAKKDVVSFPCKPRMDVLKEIIEESEGKVIVFVPFTSVLDRIGFELTAQWKVASVSGSTSKAARDNIFNEFQNPGGIHVIVANPGTMSHGLTLTAATTIVWYAPIYSNDTYLQANARVRRPGQTRTTVIVHIAGSAIERLVYSRLKNKETMQGLLLEMFNNQE